MILESAFLKLPELMLSDTQNRGRVEAMVVQHLATGLQMELNCRSIPFAYNHITVEKPYPVQGQKGSVLRADLLFDAIGTIPSTCRLDQYGYKEKQWLEAKTFFSKSRDLNPPKTKNLGKIVKDLIRLCILPQELQGRIRQNGRYMLLVFDAHPSKYLAYSNRNWAFSMFEKESSTVQIDLTQEPKFLVNAVISSDQLDAVIDISFKRYVFEPVADNPFPIYWGYLFRLESFSISIEGEAIATNGESDEQWPPDKIDQIQSIRLKFISLLRGEDDITNY
jgi:hypothetical protein